MPPSGRTASVVFLGSDAQLNATLARIEGKLKALTGVAEEQNARMAASSEAAAVKIGRAYDEGTTKAAVGLKKLSALGGSFGVPLTGSLDAVGKKLDETSVKTGKLRDTFAELGKVTLVAGVGGFAAAAYEGVKGGMALQRQMTQIQTQAGATSQQVTKMTSAVTSMAPGLATGPSALADSLYHAFSATRNMTQSLGIMSAAAKEAKISGADLTDTTTALTAAVFSGIQGAKNYTQAMGLLNATVGAGDMKFQDLNEAFAGPMLATVKGYGLSLKDVGAALATFGDLNIRGADAATQLRMAVQYMAKPAATAGPIFKALGLNVGTFAQAMANGGLLPALELLHQRLAAAGVQGNQMARVIGDMFTKRGAAGITILENSLGRLQTKYQQVGEGASKQNQAWNATQKTLAFQMDQLKATVQALADKFGLYLIPKLEAAGQAIQSVIGWMGRHKAAAEALAITIGTVLGTAITVFAYTKAVAFIKGTEDMVVGMSRVASFATGGLLPALERTGTGITDIGVKSTATAAEVEASNAAAGASFTAMGGEAAAGATAVEGAQTALASAVETSDAAIVAANESVAASYLAMLGPIGAVGAAAYALAQSGAGGPLSSAPVGSGLGGRAAGLSGGYALSPGQALGAGGHGLPKWFTGSYAAPMGGSGSTGPGGVWTGANGQVTSASFAASLLSRLGAPTSAANINALVGWIQREGSDPYIDHYNPLDTTIGGFGGRSTNSVGVKSFSSWAAGLAATVATLRQGNFAGILASLMAGHGLTGPGVSSELSAWSGGGYSSAAPAHISNPTLAALLNGTGGGEATMRYVNHRPVGVMTEAQWQAYQATHPRTTHSLLYANPLPGMTSVGRTDQGVDFSATPGSAVDAIGAGIVTSIISNWYKGQPLIEERLTQGPNKGRYVYYAEQLKSAVHVGQQLLAGQRIGTVAGSGTGLELGFGAPGGRTLAQATTGYTEGQATPAGRAFFAWMRAIGQHGIWQTTNSYTGQITGGGQGSAYSLSQLLQQFATAATTAAHSLLTRYGNVEQSGTARTLFGALGGSTGGATAGILARIIGRLGGAASLQQIDATGRHTILGAVSGSVARSAQGQQFEQTVVNLLATGQKHLADRLIAAHKAAMATLAQQLYAEQLVQDAKLLDVQTTGLKDQTQAVTDATQAMTQSFSDQRTLMQHQTDAVVQHMQDMQTIFDDGMQSMVTSIQDAAQINTDQANSIIAAINDQTQIQVDQIGERGLYGLNLVTQQLRVNADRVKAYWDRVLTNDQTNIDVLKQQAGVAEGSAKLQLDQVTAQQHANVALAQQRYDTVVLRENAKYAAAQAHVDATQLSLDTTKIGPAAIALAMHADSPASIQRLFQSQLDNATSSVGHTMQGLSLGLARVGQDAANAVGQAGQDLQGAQDTASQLIQGATDSLDSITQYFNSLIGAAQSTLSSDQGAAGIAEAGASSAVSISGAQASTQFAGTGTIVNIYGLPADNAAAIGGAVDWVARTQLQSY